MKHRDFKALSGFFASQGQRWCKGVKVVVTDGSLAYRAAIRNHLGGAAHVVDRFHGAPRGAESPRGMRDPPAVAANGRKKLRAA